MGCLAAAVEGEASGDLPSRDWSSLSLRAARLSRTLCGMPAGQGRAGREVERRGRDVCRACYKLMPHIKFIACNASYY